MGVDFVGLKISGLDELTRTLREMPAKLRARALRNALAAGGRVVRDVARSRTPVINPSSLPVRRGYRTPGTVKRAISVRTSKQARRAGDLGVFINVRPSKKGNRGAKNASDPYYWRFIEFGTRTGTRPWRFLQQGATALGEALKRFQDSLGPAIAKLYGGGR